MHGILYSQIGYDLKNPIRVIIRSDNKDHIKDGTKFEVFKGNNRILEKEIEFYGEKWGDFWWILDLSEVKKAGEYSLKVDEIYEIDKIKIGENLIFEETIEYVAIHQFEERAKQTRNGMLGWRDCGSNFREVSTIALSVQALCKLLDMGFYNLKREDAERVAAQVIRGCDYISYCMDKAQALGFKKGSIVHEPNISMTVIPSDLCLCTLAFLKACRTIGEFNLEKVRKYFNRALAVYDYLENECVPYKYGQFSASNHGAPAGFTPPNEFMTSDLLSMLEISIQFYKLGRREHKDTAKKIAKKILKRQIKPDNGKTGKYYGHFYTFDNCDFSQKMNVHHHIGHDTTAVAGLDVTPLISMIKEFYDDCEVDVYKKAVKDFAYGFFLPACFENPFYIMPVGEFNGEILNFCGPWHGFNVSMGYASRLASELEDFLNDMRFRQIATGNLLWITGLNCGINPVNLSSSVIWKGKSLDPDKFTPCSQIYGLGNNFTGCWSNIKGSIANGFSANPQFQFAVEPKPENDKPFHFCDEDWIPHSAAFIEALITLRDMKFYRDVEPNTI